jgi:hypothetical protein
MGKVIDLSPVTRQLRDGGEPPDNSDMQTRVAKLESIAEKTSERLAQVDLRLTRIEAKQDEFSKHYATKADLIEAKTSIIMWVVAAVFLAQLLPAVAGLVKHFFP